MLAKWQSTQLLQALVSPQTHQKQAENARTNSIRTLQKQSATHSNQTNAESRKNCDFKIVEKLYGDFICLCSTPSQARQCF